ncbi:MULTISPECIES: gamma-glutamylcyclotransferase family protein [Jannaschia]|nr:MULTISPECIES: gamma-glutamylcyclotransferase family protein [unclassified Jannaschia]
MDHFFGYGSLVNLSTHAYPGARVATVTGWGRAWRHTMGHDIAFLTAVRRPNAAIDGIVADVPGRDWAALDARETGYLREALPEGPAIYHIPEGHHPAPEQPRPILLSYLDVVVQGYLQQFGEAGVSRFFETTEGWDAPIQDDRAAPLYPRAQVLSRDETALVDTWLGRLGAS